MLQKLAQRKKLEFHQKVRALEVEMKSWCDRSNSQGDLEKHHTQIRALYTHLEAWHRAICQKLAQYENQEAEVFLTKCANAQKLILSEHRIWDYFRSKLVQRNEPSFLLYLKTADEFAWACYSPIQKLVFPDPASAQKKEPPLVFFNGGISPFSVSRDRTFQPEAISGEALTIAPDAWISKLPIPVVGIPWDQMSFLPQALVIGHEVGHIVEDDFGLSEGLQNCLKEGIADAGAEARKEVWQSWLGEIFADLYGCLAVGPAFAGTLIDYLIAGSEQICTEQRSAPEWLPYPTTYLRVKILLKALEEIGFGDHTVHYRELWQNYSSGMPEEFSKDIEKIVPRLLHGTHKVLKGKSVKQAFCFSEEQQLSLEDTIAELKNVSITTRPELPSNDIRVLVAAGRIAYENAPDEYVANAIAQALLEHIEKKVIKPGIRGGESKLSEEELKAKLIAQGASATEFIEKIMGEASL